ncbi:MAG: hypothetical protein KGZ33_02910 [Alkaliphilus sp.]|nr:hypothetical protein [Alkaliphilus sp.]
MYLVCTDNVLFFFFVHSHKAHLLLQIIPISQVVRRRFELHSIRFFTLLNNIT